ncbi:Small ubiquitin-related modifier 2 [Camellia lanceoleosa]|uniref:Small ubiquitin-related modifier 2 n=1 Tax=Camellia lanceoleosa TaxID=1840588 RepID=A0ACC0HRM9_9ERIC|nr:Small ubiquitin-related modifier 2 [Camellia lanceoleosa]
MAVGGGGKGRVCRKGWRGREEREIEGGLVVAVAAMVAGDRVVAEDGNEVFFRIKRSTQLRKLMTAYCDRQSVEFNSIAFLFDGRRLRGEQTPDELEMEEGDEIDAMLHQTGGGGERRAV